MCTLRLLLSVSVLAISGCALPYAGHEKSASFHPVMHAALEIEQSNPPKPVRYNLPAPELVRTHEVETELAVLSRSRYSGITHALERGGEHYARAQEIFIEEGLPVELVNVAIIESGLNPKAKSPKGALGLWQFMRGTAELYGLRTSWLGDERRNPTLSTVAAARHLRDLYTTFEDWDLALAAYNAGSAGIDRAVMRGGTNNFWELSRRGLLRRETQRYVAKFIATSIVLKEAESYGLEADIVRLAATERHPELVG